MDQRQARAKKVHHWDSENVRKNCDQGITPVLLKYFNSCLSYSYVVLDYVLI